MTIAKYTTNYLLTVTRTVLRISFSLPEKKLKCIKNTNLKNL